MQPLQLDVISTGGDCAVLRIAGEIDVYSAPQLREQIIDLADKDTLHIIADMRRVDFLDSTGLGVLVGSLKRLRQRDGSLTLVVDSERILRVFRITGLTQVFGFHSSVAEAVTAEPHWRETVEEESDVDAWCAERGL